MSSESFNVPSPLRGPFIMAAIGGILIGSTAFLDLISLTFVSPFLLRISLISTGAFLFGSGFYFMSYNLGKMEIMEHPRKLLVKGRRVGADIKKAEQTYISAWNTKPWQMRAFYVLVNRSVDLSARAIVNKAKKMIRSKGYDVSKVEHILNRAYEEYRMGTDEGMENGGKMIKEAISTAKKLKMSEKRARTSTKKAEKILNEIKAKEYARKKKEIDEAEDLLRMSRELLKSEDYKTALILAQEAQKKADEMKDIEERIKKYMRKTDLIIKQLEDDVMISPADENYVRVQEIYSAAKIMLEKKQPEISLVLMKEAKMEAEKLLPTEYLTPWDYVCPICFDYICPDKHCGLSISPSPLKEDTCRYVCECGAHYHLCCIDSIKDFRCVYCGKPLKEHASSPSS